MTNIAAGDPKAAAPQLFIPAGWNGSGQPPLYTSAQVAALTAAQPEPLHITHGPLMRHAAALLRSRKPILPDHESVAAELEMAVDGHPTPSGEPSAEWLEVARIAASQGAAERAVPADNRVPEAWTNLLAYVLQDDLHNRLTPRIIDIAYTAFMHAKRPNDEDGGASDWFNDTRPAVKELIATLRRDLIEKLAAAPATPASHGQAPAPSQQESNMAAPAQDGEPEQRNCRACEIYGPDQHPCCGEVDETCVFEVEDTRPLSSTPLKGNIPIVANALKNVRSMLEYVQCCKNGRTPFTLDSSVLTRWKYAVCDLECVAARAAAPVAPAGGNEQKALAALRYYMTECSGTEPSISVFHRMVDEALEAAPAPGDEQRDELAVELRRIAHKPGSVAVSGTLLRAAAALESCAAPQPATADALSIEDAILLQKAVTDFEECGETDVPDAALRRFAEAGYLECVHYHVMPAAQEAIEAALAAQRGGAA